MKSIIGALEQLANKRMSLQEFFRMATEKITAEIGSTRASVWSFSPQGDKIISLDLYDTRNKSHAGGIVLDQATFPEYFDAIRRNAIVCAPNAAIHPDTKCFQELYFKPNNIYSLLDFIVGSRASASGILCCEHCDVVMDWNQNQINYLEQIASSIGLALSIAQKQAA
jgi:GAF domain-containing protein